MADLEFIRARIKLARDTLDAIEADSADDELTRRRIELGRRYCEDLIRDLEALLAGRDR